MTRHYPDLGGASDWLEISFISRESSGDVAKCRPFSQARHPTDEWLQPSLLPPRRYRKRKVKVKTAVRQLGICRAGNNRL